MMANEREVNPCFNCPYTSRIEALEKDSERNSNQHKEFYKKFSDFETILAVHGERYNNLLTMMTEIKSDITTTNKTLDELKDKPAKKWDNLNWLVISSVVSTLIGIIVGKVI